MARRYKSSPTKVGSNVSQTVDVFAPPVALLCKLGSILVHLDEGAGENGHAFDWAAARSLLADREVQAWLEGMDAVGLLPVRRSDG